MAAPDHAHERSPYSNGTSTLLDLTIDLGHAVMCYTLTDRGLAYCEALQRVPLPEQQWVIRWPSAA